jgi:3'-5' exoribonuclease
MRRLFLSDCQAGDIVEDVFVVANKQIAQGTNGKFYIKFFLSDKSSQLTARIWNASRDQFNALPETGFVKLRGRVENYQNNLQIIVEQFVIAEDGFDIGDLVPHTDKSIPEMQRRLRELLDSIQNRHLAALIDAYLSDVKLMEDFSRAPAAQSFHHAFLGGLLEHTLNAMEVADAAMRFYPGLNRDLVLAGLFLHDIAKTWELTYDTSFGYSDSGHLVGHLVKSAMWVEQKALAAEKVLGEKIPQPLIDTLQHIILSHHEKPEFGAAKVPATPEALFVSMIDNMDAKMMIAIQACRGEFGGSVAGDGNWTEYIKSMGGRLYRPDVAPSDPVETGPPIAREAKPPSKPVLNNPMFETAPLKKK